MIGSVRDRLRDADPLARPIIERQEVAQRAANEVHLDAHRHIKGIAGIIVRYRVKHAHGRRLISIDGDEVTAPATDVLLGGGTAFLDLGDNIVEALLQESVFLGASAEIKDKLKCPSNGCRKRKPSYIESWSEQVGDSSRTRNDDNKIYHPVHRLKGAAPGRVIQRVAERIELNVPDLVFHLSQPFLPPPPLPLEVVAGRGPNPFVLPWTPRFPSPIGFGCGFGCGVSFVSLSLIFVSVRVSRAGMKGTGSVAATQSHISTGRETQKRRAASRPLRIAV